MQVLQQIVFSFFQHDIYLWIQKSKKIYQEISKIYNLKIDWFIIQEFDDLEKLYFDEDNLHTLEDSATLNVVEKKVTNSTFMTHNISESEEECQEASNMNTDPIVQSSSNGDENQSTFEEIENIRDRKFRFLQIFKFWEYFIF